MSASVGALRRYLGSSKPQTLHPRARKLHQGSLLRDAFASFASPRDWYGHQPSEPDEPDQNSVGIDNDADAAAPGFAARGMQAGCSAVGFLQAGSKALGVEAVEVVEAETGAEPALAGSSVRCGKNSSLSRRAPGSSSPRPARSR